MGVTSVFTNFAYAVFGPLIDSIMSKKGDFYKTMRRANLKLTMGEYLSMAILFILVSTPILILIMISILTFLGINYILPAIMALILIPTFLFALFYIYPSYVADNRKRNIDAKLPFAVPFMAAMAGAGVPPNGIFLSISTTKLYGEISEEAKNIVRDTYFFGRDIVSVLDDYTRITPSRKFSELLQGIVTAIRAGGDLKLYLFNEADKIMTEYRRMMKDYAEVLGLLAEGYITVPVFGTIFGVIIFSVMGMISAGGNILGPFSITDILYILVYLGIPALSILFIIIIDSVTPEE